MARRVRPDPNAARRPTPSPALDWDADAASEVLGSILLVGVTVLMVGGLAVVLASQPGPVEQRYADLAMSLAQGNGDWGTGDEEVRIEHRGGEAFDASTTRITYRIGGIPTTLSGTDLGGAFADGRFTIGETWTRTANIPVATPVDVDVVAQTDSGSALVSNSRLSATCSDDSTPPSVQAWTQVPPDASSTTTGALTVTALVADACAGVDPSAAPNLHYRINDGSNPAYTNGGPMASTGPATWRASVAGIDWSASVGHTLQYYADPLTDLQGNAGPSVVRSDPIQPDCSGDTSAPTVLAWTQTPSDITTATSGSVSVQAVLQDLCAGVDNAANPQLHWRIDPGTNPAFTNAGEMTRTTTNTWQITFGGPTWGGDGTWILEYELRMMRDLNGNTGTSTRQTDTLQGSCAADTQAPSVQTWTQTPSNLATDSGPVTITALLSDDCAGVDNTANPELFYRFNDGTDPAFLSGGTMTRTAANTWEKATWNPGWSSNALKTFQYEIRSMTDLNGNTGTSPLQSDLIEQATIYTYVNSNGPNVGTVASFANAQSATDSDAFATIQEANTAGSASPLYDASDASGTGWSTPAGVLADNDGSVATSTTANSELRINLDDPAVTSATISSVIIKVNAYVTPSGGQQNDGWTLQACINTTCNAATATLPAASATATILSYDISCQRPGSGAGTCGAWTMSDITNLNIRLTTKLAGSVDGTWTADYGWVEVTASATPQYTTTINMAFTGVPEGSNVLQLRYRTSGDTYNVAIMTGSTPRLCTGTLSHVDASTFADYTCALTADERQSGNPSIRITDVNPTSATQGSLFLEYVRVRTN